MNEEKYSWAEASNEAEQLGVGPISLMFYKCIGRLPTDEELKAYIDLVIMPDDACYTANGLLHIDRVETLQIRELQKQKLLELIKKNDRTI